MPSSRAKAPIFTIGCREIEGGEPTARALGFKAFNLWRMARLGLPVPPAFVLGTDFCALRARGESAYEGALRDALSSGLARLEAVSGLQLGNERRPLVVSVRSGAPVSMPGMLETVLNVGLNDDTVRGLVRITGNPRTAWESYRHLVRSFAVVVHGKPATAFDAAEGEAMREAGLDDPRALDFEQSRDLAARFLEIHEDLAGVSFPQDPRRQLEAAAGAVFDSWRAPKAVAYRRMNAVDDSVGTAATVQQMVFGNSGAHSGSGVGFSRDPATGERKPYIDFLFNAQGEELVSGRRGGDGGATLSGVLPAVHESLVAAAELLERELHDLQEFEFTVQEGRLYLLQTRSGKRTPLAAARVAVDMVREKLLTPDEALERVGNIDMARLVHVRRVGGSGGETIARGNPAGPGIASGPIALSPKWALECAAKGTPAILVREMPVTEDIEGLTSAAGLLTISGARTAHAVVVARQLGKVCLLGCKELTIEAHAGRCTIGGEAFTEGTVITLDGDRGEVVRGRVETVTEPAKDLIAAIESWRKAGLTESVPAA